MKKKILEIIIQIIPVMIGVYLGFVVSDWSDSQKRKVQSVRLLENIRSEINTNKQIVAGGLDYHEMVRDSSRYYSGDGLAIGRPAFFQGTRHRTLVNSAYKTGVQTGVINELPINSIQELNQLYTLQDSYNDYGKMQLEGLINKDFFKDEESIGGIARYLSMTMTDIVIKENYLLQKYRTIESELKKIK
ncbi:MAG TPA: hypothetical protein ENJ95_16510 [Bacteroidetes bacterium]|nr:hypothetical protein [Bacteroidota bacterium]